MRSHPESSEQITKGRNNSTEMTNTNDRVLEVVPNRYEHNNVEGNRKSVMFISMHYATATWRPNEILRWQSTTAANMTITASSRNNRGDVITVAMSTIQNTCRNCSFLSLFNYAVTTTEAMYRWRNFAGEEGYVTHAWQWVLPAITHVTTLTRIGSVTHIPTARGSGTTTWSKPPWAMTATAYRQSKNLQHHCHPENSSSLDTVRGQLCRWGDQAMAWTSQGSIPVGGMSFALLKHAQTGSAAHPVSPVLSTGGSFPRKYVIIYLRLVQSLRVSGAIPPFPPNWPQGAHKDKSSFCLLLESKLCQHAGYPNSKSVRQSSTSYSSPRLLASKTPIMA